MKLFYLQPASKWVEALPQGNGRLGTMVFGGVAQERVGLNEDTLWAGHPGDHIIPGAGEHIKRITRMILDGKNAEAEKALEDEVLSEYTDSYTPLGDLWMDFPALEGKEFTDYRRELDLATGLAQTTFTCEGVQYKRVSLVSYPQQAAVLRMEASEKVLAVKLSLDSQLRYEAAAQGAEIVMTTRCPSQCLPSYYNRTPEAIAYDDAPEKQGISAATILQTATDGVIEAKCGELEITGASFLEVRLVCRSNFEGFDKYPGLSKVDYLANARADMQAVAAMSFEEIKAAHLADFAPQMALQGIDVQGENHEDLPTDERLRRYTAGGEDITLPVLLYQFGRYLLLSGSRPGTTALNLQGIWNEEMQPPWSSNYTTNINTEMNYWPAEITGIPGVHEPLFDLLDALTVTGGKVAKEYFGARGATTNHNTDLWAHATPVGAHSRGSAGYGWWPMAYGWLSGHVFEHFIYTADKAFLKERALPVLRSAALFFIDACTTDEEGYRSIRPATSPENRFWLDGKRLAVCKTATVNEEIIREVLIEYLAAMEILGEEEPDAAAARELLAALPPLRIGKDGRLMEWDEEYDEPEPQHRHISHLTGLFPGHLHSPRKDKHVTEAIKASLAVRGDDGTGWSLGWKVNIWARLEDGDHAMKLLHQQLRLVDDGGYNYSNGGGSYANMFCAHPPFQIDGNFAASSGVPRLLMDSHLDEIAILPALPSTWQNLEAHGLCGANGYRADLCIKDGKLVSLRLTAGSDRPTKVRLGDKEITLCLNKGDVVENPAELMG